MFRSTISNLNQKMEAITVASTLMKDEVENTKSSLVQLQQENSMLRCESNALLEGHQRQLLVRISITSYRHVIINAIEILEFLINPCTVQFH